MPEACPFLRKKPIKIKQSFGDEESDATEEGVSTRPTKPYNYCNVCYKKV